MKKNYLLLTTYYLLLFLLFVAAPLTALAQEQPAFQEIKPRLQIPVPGVNFSRVTQPDESGFLAIAYLPEYIAAVYSYFVGLAGLLATVMIMYAGMKWIFAGGDSGKISAAKETIHHAVIGLVLAVGSYLILFTLNPKLTTFEALRIRAIPREPYVEGGDAETPLGDNALANARSIGINCPESGGIAAVQNILSSMSGKVAYRYGGKGGPPPYYEKPDGNFTEFNDACPNGNLCLDCSGFINLVYRCAGMTAPGGGTGNIFSNAEEVTEIDAKKNEVNDQVLNPGDLLGWRAGDNGKAIGHVIMYIGDGMVAESKGGRSGRQPGANPRIISLQRLDYPITRIRRAPQ